MSDVKSTLKDNRWALRIIVVLLLVAVAVRWASADEASSLHMIELRPTAFGPANAEAAEARMDRDVASAAARSQARPGEWLAMQGEAMALHRRGQHMADFDEMAQAYTLLADARAEAPDKSGPLLASAVAAFSLHRNAETERYLDAIDKRAVPPLSDERAEIEALRGDLSLYGGDYDGALAHYDRSAAISHGPGVALRLANLQQRLGQFDAALETIAGAASRVSSTSPKLMSTYLIHAGGIELKRGNWRDARAYFERADTVFPGYWLTSAHIAQLDAAQGDLSLAQARYRDILSSHTDPTVMMAYAKTLDAAGRPDDARNLVARAEIILKGRAEQFPEAYADHLLDASIVRGEPAAAMRYARINVENRPYGDAQIGMARALILSGKPKAALAILDRVEASGWRSTEQYLSRAQACEAIRDEACVYGARRAAQKFNPKAYDPGSAMLAFGNH